MGARIYKCLRSPGIEESIPQAYEAWYAKKDFLPSQPGWESIYGLLKRFTNMGSAVVPLKKIWYGD